MNCNCASEEAKAKWVRNWYKSHEIFKRAYSIRRCCKTHTCVQWINVKNELQLANSFIRFNYAMLFAKCLQSISRDTAQSIIWRKKSVSNSATNLKNDIKTNSNWDFQKTFIEICITFRFESNCGLTSPSRRKSQLKSDLCRPQVNSITAAPSNRLIMLQFHSKALRNTNSTALRNVSAAPQPPFFPSSAPLCSRDHSALNLIQPFHLIQLTFHISEEGETKSFMEFTLRQHQIQILSSMSFCRLL